MKRTLILAALLVLAAACSRREQTQSALTNPATAPQPPAAAQVDPYASPDATAPAAVRREPVPSYPDRSEPPRAAARRQPSRPRAAQAEPRTPPVYRSETAVPQEPVPPVVAQEQGNRPAAYPEDYPEMPQSVPLPSTAVTPREEPRERTIVIPAGTGLTVRVLDRITSDYSKGDERFTALLDHDVTENGEVVLPARTEVNGRLVSVREAGKVSGRAEIVLELDSITLDGREYDLRTNRLTMQAENSVKSDAARIGGAAAVGALIGAITGGKKGAAIGATVGAGGGTASVLTTRGKAVQIERETPLRFKLESPLEVVIP